MPTIVPNGMIGKTRIAAIIPQGRAFRLRFSIFQLAKATGKTKIAPNIV